MDYEKKYKDERLRKTTIDFLKVFADKGYENAVECIDWLEKQSKSMWKEEDEKNLNKLDVILYEYKDMSNQCYWDIINWLKSLKQRIEA